MPGTGKGPHLHELAASNLEEIARFINRASGSETPISQSVERFSWILLNNPARQSGDPLGWLLRAPSGEVVGCLCCAPQKFRFGEKTFSLLMANYFYVDDGYRGAGASLFLKYLQLGRRYPLFVSSANPIVAEMWRKLGGYSLANSDHEVLGIVRWPSLLEESVYRKTGSDRIAWLVSTLASPFGSRRKFRRDDAAGELLPLSTPEEAASLCAQHHSAKITNCRDIEFLKWRYFSSIGGETCLFAFSSTDLTQNQFLVAIRLQNRGYKQQIRALQVLDIWGEPDLKTRLAIAACLWRDYADEIDALVFRCLDATAQQALKTQGFKVRSFEAPIAWCIDKYRLLPSQDWYFVPADGDMFL
jgi:hypothetical protein